MKVLTNCALFVLLVFLVLECINCNQLISVVLQKCSGTCNKEYCNIKFRCRPLNRTSKRVSLDFYFNQGVTLEAQPNFSTKNFIESQIEVIAYKKFRTEYRPLMVKLKTEWCAQVISMDHPYFRLVSGYWKSELKGNLFDPCPLIGHRFLEPYISSHPHAQLIPVGEWKLSYSLSKNINNSDVFIASWSLFYEIKPTSAEEF